MFFQYNTYNWRPPPTLPRSSPDVFIAVTSRYQWKTKTNSENLSWTIFIFYIILWPFRYFCWPLYVNTFYLQFWIHYGHNCSELLLEVPEIFLGPTGIFLKHAEAFHSFPNEWNIFQPCFLVFLYVVLVSALFASYFFAALLLLPLPVFPLYSLHLLSLSFAKLLHIPISLRSILSALCAAFSSALSFYLHSSLSSCLVLSFNASLLFQLPPSLRFTLN